MVETMTLLKFMMLSVAVASLVATGSCQDAAQDTNQVSSMSSLKSVLHHVTNSKLDELKRQKTLMNSHFQPILDQVSKIKAANPKEALQLLVTGQINSPIKDIFSLPEIEKVKTLLKNAVQDPSISNELLSLMTEKLKEGIYYSLRKCDYSFLYGTLLKEWLDVQNIRASATADINQTSQDQNSIYKVAEAKELAKFKKMMFSSTDFDVAPLQSLFNDLLNLTSGLDIETIRKIESLQKVTPEAFKHEQHVISVIEIRHCMKGLIAGDLLSTEKKAALRELTENLEAVQDVASLLTSTLRNLDRWEWNTFSTNENVIITRGLAGEYKVQLDEDILTALFLQYIGVYWGVYFKGQFLTMYNDRLWQNDNNNYYSSIDYIRRNFHRSALLTSLPNSMSTQEKTQLDEYVKIVSDITPEREESVRPKSFRLRGKSRISNVASVSMDMEDDYQPLPKPILPPPKPDIDFKQKFLHVLSTEIRLNQVIRQNSSFTVIQTEFEKFTCSISHESILATMEFFGVSKQWVTFFKKFLQPKIKFPGDAASKKVRRGVPADHVLSNVFSESLLFLMEFHLYSRVEKAKLYRISDEFWYWNHNITQTLRAWINLSKFAELVGLKFDKSRSGSVSIYSDEELGKNGEDDNQIQMKSGPKPLPQRGIHWGYLNLFSDGGFRIDQNSTENFITEMRGQLNKSESVLDWILAYNKYMPFFIRNFGKSALVLGIQHQDQIIESLKKFHDDVFRILQISANGSTLGNPLCALKEKFPTLSDMNVIDAWVYWPLEKGGLGLTNPFINVMLLREAYQLRNDTVLFRDLPLLDKIEWENLKKIYEESLQHQKYKNPYPEKAFDTWEEYISKRESSLPNWGNRYTALLEVLDPIRPSVSARYPRNLYEGTNEEERNYFMSLFNYYEHQLLKHFGSVDFINTQLLPSSLIKNILKTKLKY